MNLLYCANGAVVAIHDDMQTPVDASLYGSGVRVVPYDQPLNTLAKVGNPPPDMTPPIPDTRLYAQPTETVELLLAYAAQVRWQTVTNGITVNAIPVRSDRVSQTLIANLAQYAATLAPTDPIDFTQDAVHYPITAQDAIDMNNQLSSFIQQCRTTEAACIADLNSQTPTILTYDDVDAKFAGLRARTVRQ